MAEAPARGPASEDEYKAERRVADIWSSEQFFLYAAATLTLVAIYYAYVLLTGGE